MMIKLNIRLILLMLTFTELLCMPQEFRHKNNLMATIVMKLIAIKLFPIIFIDQINCDHIHQFILHKNINKFQPRLFHEYFLHQASNSYLPSKQIKQKECTYRQEFVVLKRKKTLGLKLSSIN